MKDEEKNLIENLFHRLKNTELNSSERDISAENLIQKLVNKQPASSYYMVQTILIQETAIKKMSKTIEELQKKINYLNNKELNKKTSFLSTFFKKNPNSSEISYNNDAWKKQDKNLQPSNPYANVSPTTQATTSPIINSTTKSSGFLSNALQTATGVAGGMILGNMLMNVFNHTKPEEEMFDTINKPDSHSHEENLSSETHQNNLVNYEYDEPDINNANFSNTDSITQNNNIIDTYDTDADIDTDDDNFI